MSITYRFYDAFVKESQKYKKRVVLAIGQKNAPVTKTGAFCDLREA